MVNQAKIEADIVLVREEITTILSQLKELDRNRPAQLKLIKKKSGNYNREALEIFLEQTQDSIDLLRKFEKTFLQILALVLLARAEGHRDAQFQLLLQRYRSLETLITDLTRNREKQISVLASLLWKGQGTHQIPVQKIRNWRLRSLLQEEDRIFGLIQAVYTKDRQALEEIRQRLTYESRWERGITLTAFASWLIPGLGTICFFAITQTYGWANQHTPNMRILTSLSQGN